MGLFCVFLDRYGKEYALCVSVFGFVCCCCHCYVNDSNFFCFRVLLPVDASNGNLKVTKLKIEKKEKIVFFGGGGVLLTRDG